MTEQVQLALIAIVVPTLTAFGVLYVAIQTRREAKEAAAVLVAEAAALKATQDEAAKKLGEIGKATDGTLSALKAANDELQALNRRQELVISNFTAVQAAVPALAKVHNGRTEPPEPVPVYTAPGDNVEVVTAPGTDDGKE